MKQDQSLRDKHVRVNIKVTSGAKLDQDGVKEALRSHAPEFCQDCDMIQIVEPVVTEPRIQTLNVFDTRIRCVLRCGLSRSAGCIRMDEYIALKQEEVEEREREQQQRLTRELSCIERETVETWGGFS